MTGPLSTMVGLVEGFWPPEGFRPSDMTQYQVCETQDIVYCIVIPERASERQSVCVL